MRPDGSAGSRPVVVWDPLVRIGHWTLAACVLFAWLTRHGGGPWHEALGYGALVVVGLRLLWGWTGSRYARFASFVRSPGSTLGYIRDLLRGVEARHLGHNPLGGWMIMVLLTTVTLTCVSGWLYTTDAFWGVEWVEDTHNTLTNILIVLVALHVIGVLHASFRHRENLVAAMFHGRKRSQ